MGSLKESQRVFWKYRHRSTPSKSYIQILVEKLEMMGIIVDQHAGGQKLSDQTGQEI
jgi:hypothetical protein